MTRALRTLVSLSRADAVMLCRASLLLAVTRAALWMLPYRWVQRALAPERVWRRDARRGKALTEDPLTLARYQRRVVWAVGAASRRLLPRKPCLTQALVARWLLARAGVPSDMQIGVTFGEARNLLAHAWLEQDGRVILGGADSPARYTPLRAVEAKAV